MSKIGLIVEGGGMKCAYSAGVLDNFLDEGYKFDYCIGVSAGSANLASYVAGQRERNKRYYCQHVTDPRYISIRNFLKTGSLFGLHYIYADMTNEGGGDPLDYDAMQNNPIEFCLPATDAETGLPRYFVKDEIRRNSYEPIMGSCCLPVACKVIEYEGHKYYDGGVADSVPIKKALEDGCDKVVVIYSKPRGFRMKPEGLRWLYTPALKKYPKIVECLNNRHIVYNESMDIVDELEKQGKAITFCPSDKIKIGTYTKDPKVMEALYDNGMLDAVDAKSRLAEFLS